jgi:hypothetical protein
MDQAVLFQGHGFGAPARSRGKIMNRNRIASAVVLTAAFVASAAVLHAQNASGAEFVVTNVTKSKQAVRVLQQKDITVLVKNRATGITSFEPARGPNAPLQLVFLFDESAPGYLALQIPSIRKFIDALPASTEVAVAYMSNGRAVMSQTLTGDHALAGKGLRLTTAIPGISGSPYFCLSDLAKHWPAQYQSGTRRVVFMVTNGEDPYYMQQDLQDPYVNAAIADSQRASLLVYSIYFRDIGFRRAGSLGVLFGQSYLQMVASGTGGQAYNEAMTSPVSFDPFLDMFRKALDNQYMVAVAAQGKGLERIKVKSNTSGLKIAAPSAINLSAN